MFWLVIFNRAAPKISRGIRQVAAVGRNIGQVVKHSRYIGSIANEISDCSIAQSPTAPKEKDVAHKIENGAFVILLQL